MSMSNAITIKFATGLNYLSTRCDLPSPLGLCVRILKPIFNSSICQVIDRLDPIYRHDDNAMVKAIARAFRWRGLLEKGAHATIAEIAAAEKINESYVGRILRLTLLAPDIIEAILDGRQPTAMTLAPRRVEPGAI
jgi:hypothetical protein